MHKAKFAIIMLSEAYWKSDACVEELKSLLKRKSKCRIFIVRFDKTCHTCMGGNFLGESEEQIDATGFIKSKLDMNCIPPPHAPLFQKQFEVNATELIYQLRRFLASQAVAGPRRRA